MTLTEQFQYEFLATYRRTKPGITRTDGAFRSAVKLMVKCCYGEEWIVSFVYMLITEKFTSVKQEEQSVDRFKMAFFVFSLDHFDPLDGQYYWTDLIKSVLKENDDKLHSRYLQLEQEHEAGINHGSL